MNLEVYFLNHTTGLRCSEPVHSHRCRLSCNVLRCDDNASTKDWYLNLEMIRNVKRWFNRSTSSNLIRTFMTSRITGWMFPSSLRSFFFSVWNLIGPVVWRIWRVADSSHHSHIGQNGMVHCWYFPVRYMYMTSQILICLRNAHTWISFE